MGMQPIAGYNYGAKKNDRVFRVYKLTVLAATCITTFGFLLALLFSNTIVSAFTSDIEMKELSSAALRIVLIAFPIVGFQVVTSNFFQSIGKAKLAIFLSISRQLIFLVPGLLILPRFLGMNGVWIALPTGDILASILTLVVILRQRKKLFNANTF